MSVFFAHTLRAAVNTSSGNQTFTHGTLTETPILARFVLTNAIANDTLTTHACLGWGWAHDAVQFSFAQSGDDASAVTDAWSIARNTDCVYLIDQNGTCIAQGQFVSFGAGAVTVNWITAPSAAYLLTIELYGGTALEVGSFEFLDNFSSPATFTLFDTPCENENLVGWGGWNQGFTFGDAAVGGAQLGIGFFANGTALTQGVMAWYDRTDSGLTRLVSNYVGDTKFAAEHDDTALAGDAYITAIDDQTVTMDSTLGGMSVEAGAMLAMRLKGSRGFTAKVVAYQAANSTGANKSATGFGFTPMCVLQATSMCGSKGTVINNTNAEGCGLGFWNSHGEQFVNMVHAKDGLGGSRRLRVNTIWLDVMNAAGARLQGTYNVAHNDGWNYTLASSVTPPRYQIALAIAIPPGVIVKQGVKLKGGVRLA